MTPPDSLLDDLRVLEPSDPMRYLYWGLGVLGIIVLCLLVRSVVRSLKARSNGASSGEIKAAQEDALAELERLFSLVEEGQSKPYAIESSGIVRRYIERRFSIRAPQRSTEEFLHDVQRDPVLNSSYRELLGEFLRCCDYIKFGRGMATREELAELHSSAVQFVRDSATLEERS